MNTARRSASLCALLALLALSGCDDDSRARDDLEADGAVDLGLGDLGPGDGDLPDGDLADAETPDGGLEDGELPDAAPPDADLPDFEPPPPEVCNGLDEDRDGLIDEGLSNICGGCEDIPEGGCQAWRVALIQGQDGEADLRRIVGFQGAFDLVDVIEVENATCERVRSVAPSPTDHIGDVTVDSPRLTVTHGPTYDPAQGIVVYSDVDDPPLDAGRAFNPGDVIDVSGTGSELVDPFSDSLIGPDTLTGVEPDTLSDVIQLARGNIDGPVELTWAPARRADLDGVVQLFIGGSFPLFNRGSVYRAIHSFTLDAALADDGAFSILPSHLPALELAAVRVRLSRSDARRVLLGPHALELLARQQVERVQSGDVSGGLDAPFHLTAPDPDVRQIEPGAPFTVSWSALPDGDGPLSVGLVLLDPAEGTSTQINCVVEDPGLGEMIMPGELTEAWPTGPGARRLLDVRWNERVFDLPLPDQGGGRFSLSLILDLEE